MVESKRSSQTTWVDPDDAPDMSAAYWEGKGVVHRGRPKSAAPKIATTIRIDADILARFREGGSGWQTRINAALREWLAERGDVEEARAQHAELIRMIEKLEAQLEAYEESASAPVERPAGA